MKIIDIHSHFFNLKYLPVAGIIMRYSNGKVSSHIANGIEWLLLKYTRSDFETTAETLDMPGKKSLSAVKAFRVLGEPEVYQSMDEIFHFSPEDTAAAISHTATPEDLTGDNPLTKALDEFEKLKGIEYIDPAPVTKAFASPENARLFSLFDKLQQMLQWLMNKVEELRNYLKWFFFMTNSEEEMLAYLQKHDAQPVEHFLHLMMDVDDFFNEPAGSKGYRSHFDFVKEQIPNMQKLNTKYAAKITGFVAFNPARKNGLDIVKDAIEHKGFKGVKFYPPLGYRAFDDPKYKTEIEALINYCADNRVPLFTHCNNEGFQAQPNGGHSGYNSNPVYWEKALEKRPELILCLAHGGGVEGWFGTNVQGDHTDPGSILADDIKNASRDQENWNHSYAAMVYKLCCTYDNVYCDASYLDEMINSNGTFEEGPRKNFKARLLKLFAASPVFSKKIMYGSDWHMLFQEAKNNVYLGNYLTFFIDTEFDHYRDDFFYNNARRYLQLNPVA